MKEIRFKMHTMTMKEFMNGTYKREMNNEEIAKELIKITIFIALTAPIFLKGVVALHLVSQIASPVPVIFK